MDDLKSFVGFEQAGLRHIPRTQPLQGDLRKGAKSVVPFADRAIANLQQWLIGTYHGVSRDQLQVYLDEFVFSPQSSPDTHGRIPDNLFMTQRLGITSLMPLQSARNNFVQFSRLRLPPRSRHQHPPDPRPAVHILQQRYAFQ
jgi:hypothetical protein